MKRILKRIIYEIYNPSKRISKHIIRKYVSLKNYLKFSNKNKNIFIACWDLAAVGGSFDFGFFLAAADYISQKKGYHDFCILIIESKGEKFSIKSKSDNLSWRLSNIIYPLCQMYERCTGFEYISDKSKLKSKLNLDNVEFYPENYDLNHIRSFEYSDIIYEDNLFKIISGFKSNPLAITYCEKYLDIKKNIVSITLRSENFAAAKNKLNFNSNIKEWLIASKYFIKKGFEVIIIPDTFSTHPFEFEKIGCKVFNLASQNLMLRMAIYEKATVNMFVPMGPATLAYLNKNISYIVFKFFTKGVMYSPGVEEATIEARWKQFRIKPGKSWKFAKSTQIISKYKDDSQYIIEEFDRFLNVQKEK
tara:strand:- start:484 stop:1569 length:1086 start_codon:yes stop_codon:yes gene_type:complete